MTDTNTIPMPTYLREYLDAFEKGYNKERLVGNIDNLRFTGDTETSIDNSLAITTRAFDGHNDGLNVYRDTVGFIGTCGTKALITYIYATEEWDEWSDRAWVTVFISVKTADSNMSAVNLYGTLNITDVLED